MKVYLLWEKTPYETPKVVGIFATEDAAKAAMPAQNPDGDWCHIIEMREDGQ